MQALRSLSRQIGPDKMEYCCLIRGEITNLRWLLLETKKDTYPVLFMWNSPSFIMMQRFCAFPHCLETKDQKWYSQAKQIFFLNVQPQLYNMLGACFWIYLYLHTHTHMCVYMYIYLISINIPLYIFKT